MAGIYQDFSQSLRRSLSPPPTTYNPGTTILASKGGTASAAAAPRAPPRAPRRSRSRKGVEERLDAGVH